MMNSDEMEIDREQSKKKKIEAFQAFVEGSLASAVTKLNGSARGIPSSKDYHFYNNFQEFKGPMKEIAEKSKMMLREIGSSKNPWGKSVPFPDDSDDSYDWLVDRNDDAFEKIDASVDEEFQRLRAKEEENVKTTVDSEDGFQLVSRKNKKGGVIHHDDGAEKDDGGQNSSGISTVKMAFKDKKTSGARPQIPFHIPTIPRPQDEFRIVVNNSNNPFEHVWLQKSEDGSKFIHPLVSEYFRFKLISKSSIHTSW